jgi:hypothetical protein
VASRVRRRKELQLYIEVKVPALVLRRRAGEVAKERSDAISNIAMREAEFTTDVDGVILVLGDTFLASRGISLAIHTLVLGGTSADAELATLFHHGSA